MFLGVKIVPHICNQRLFYHGCIMLASWLFQLTGSNFEPLNLHLFDFTGGLFSTRMPAFKRDPKDPKRANPARYPQHHVIIESHNIISLSFRFNSKHESRHQNFKPFPTITSCFLYLKKKKKHHFRWPQGNPRYLHLFQLSTKGRARNCLRSGKKLSRFSWTQLATQTWTS